MVSYMCAIVTLSLKRAVFSYLTSKCLDFEIRVRGHSRSLKVVPFGTLCTVSYYCSVSYSNFVRNFVSCRVRYSTENAVTLKTGLGVREGH